MTEQDTIGMDLTAAKKYLGLRSRIADMESDLKLLKQELREREGDLMEWMGRQDPPQSRIAIGDALIYASKVLQVSVNADQKVDLIEYCQAAGLEHCVDDKPRVVTATLKSSIREMIEDGSFADDDHLRLYCTIFEGFQLKVNRS